jgi:hypothetical protein
MSELRLWVHEQIARLDGRRERRFVALAAALAFAILAVGPQAMRAVDAAANAPDIRIDELGPDPVAVPLRFHATALNIQLAQVVFLVQSPDGSILNLVGRTTAADPSRWESEPFDGTAGQTFVVKARGFATTAGTAVESSQPMTFSVLDPNAATQPTAGTSPTSGTGTSGGGTSPSPGTTVQKTVEIEFASALPGTEPRIEAKGLTTGFDATSAHYRVLALTGQNFLVQPAATLGTDGKWHAIFPVPGGELYRVTLVASDAGTPRESLPRDLTVPPPETAPTAPTAPAPTAPAPTPVVALLAPTEGAEALSPIPLAARVANATATSVTFEIVDPAGVTRSLSGSAAAGNWNAMFVGLPGQYGVRFRTALADGTVIPPGSYRPFRILPPPDAATAATTTPTTTATATAPVAAQPVVELFAPAPDAPPFAGPVPLSARVLGGAPTRMVAIVSGNAGGETIVVASKTATGDFWNGVFEGPDGDYRFRMRATVGGLEHFSPERRFSVKRPATATQPPPPPASDATAGTAGSPPPPPPPEATSTEAAPRPAPLPPPPTGAMTAVPTSAPVPDAMAAECRAAGIQPERCAEWLKAKYQSRECLEAGARTREACEELLSRLNLPFDASKVIGMAGAQEIEEASVAARAVVGKALAPTEMPEAIGRLLAFEPRPEERWRVMASKDDAPALLVLDNDGDGLPDDVERRYGTDPRALDTDGDGFSDGMEVKNGYNPLGAGTLQAPIRGVEKALIDGAALEEPRGAETLIDPAFTIAADAPAPDEGEAPADAVRLSGVAAPNSVVTIFIYSYLPVVVTTTTDENGNWTYEFGGKLAEGRHEAYVSVNDDTGKLVATSSPLAFFVREAQAVTEEDFLRPDVNVEEAPAELSRRFVYGGIALVALAIVLVAAIVRQVRKNPMPDAGL